jgi:hypothetical protein
MKMFVMIQRRAQKGDVCDDSTEGTMAGWTVCFALWLLGLMQHPRTSALSPNALFDAELAIWDHR